MSTSAALESVANVAEFVDKMNPTGEGSDEEEDGSKESSEGPSSTLDARQKKLEELRKRMVRTPLPLIDLYRVWTMCDERANANG